MSIFQKAYDWVDGWKAPAWLKALLQSLNDLMLAVLKEVSQQYINYIKNQITYAAGQNWTAEEKFNYVFNQAKTGLTEFSITLKDREINLLIEFLVAQLKGAGV